MADQGMPTSYDTRTTTTTTSSTAIGFHPEYVKSIPGILKCVEIVLDLIVFICAIVKPGWNPYGGGWVEFVSITAFVCTGILLGLYLTAIWARFPPIRVMIEFIYYCVFTVFFLIAAIVAAARGHWHASIGAAAFFAFAATAVYAVDTFFQFRAWRSGQTEMTTGTTVTTSQSTHSVEAAKTTY